MTRNDLIWTLESADETQQLGVAAAIDRSRVSGLSAARADEAVDGFSANSDRCSQMHEGWRAFEKDPHPTPLYILGD
jgi:hypothetical protein